MKLLAFLLAIISAQEITIKIANKKLNLKHFYNDSSQFGQLMVAVSEAGRAREGEKAEKVRQMIAVWVLPGGSTIALLS